MSLLMAVERHLRTSAVSASRFGRQVSGDPRFVFDLRRGREPRPATTARVLAHIAGAEGGKNGHKTQNSMGEAA